VVKRYIGFELQRLREASGLGQPEAAKHIDTSKARIGHLENGRTMPKLPEVDLLLTLYGAPDLVEGIQDLIVQVREAERAGNTFELDPSLDLLPGFSLYVGLEQGASRIFTYDAVVIKGILHCPEYAAAMIRRAHLGDDLTDEQVEGRVRLRTARQAILDRPGVRLTAVIDEGVLRKQLGGRAVAAAQAAYLLAVAERDNVTIRVISCAGDVHPALQGPFTRLEFPIERDPGVVYLEDLSGGRYRDDTDVIAEYTQLEDRLLAQALPERESLALIDTIRKEYQP
jgi:transcriptional regulator with XRE-family HTH domain